jgi:hypothetical protein
MTNQGKRSETSAALGDDANKGSSPERAAQFGLAMGRICFALSGLGTATVD